MSLRQRNQRRENNSDDEDGFGWKDVVAAGAALAGGIYVLSKMFNGSSENEREIPPSPSTRRSLEEQPRYTGVANDCVPNFSNTNSFNNSSTNKHRIKIVIDATPEKCGGFIIFPKDKKIKYYSTTWSPYYKFPSMDGEPDKFEMLNALVALIEFENVIQKKMYGYEGLTIKTDSLFCQSTYKRDEHSNLKKCIENKKDDLNGEWEKVTKKEDTDMKIADRLSRSKIYIESMYNMAYPDYALKEFNVEHTLSMIKNTGIIPSKYHL